MPSPSALFGADASAGVINVITKAAGSIEDSQAGIRAGSFDTRSAWLQHGHREQDIEFAMTAEVSTTDGHDPYIRADAISGSSVSHSPGEAPMGWDDVDLRMSLARGDWRLMYDFEQHTDIEIGLTGGYVIDSATRASDSRHNLGILFSDDTFRTDWGIDAELRFRHLAYSSGEGFYENPLRYRA